MVHITDICPNNSSRCYKQILEYHSYLCYTEIMYYDLSWYSVHLMHIISFNCITLKSYLGHSWLFLGEDLELECITIGANPPAKLRWFLGEQEIHTGHRQENSRGKSTTSSSSSEDELSGKARTWTSISRLTLPVSKSDNNAILRCLAEHPALLVGETLVSSKFLTIHCKF